MIFNPAQTFKFHRAEDKEEKKLSKELMKAYLLTDGFAHEAMETLVMHFFRFTPRDLKEWEEEPDEWEKSQEGGGEDWEYSIRTCAEKLFLDLMINYKDMLVQPLMEVFKTVGSTFPVIPRTIAFCAKTIRRAKYRCIAKGLDLCRHRPCSAGPRPIYRIRFWKLFREHPGAGGPDSITWVQYLAPASCHSTWSMVTS